MPNVVVVGVQWGDEGKGKVVDVLTPHAEAVVRFQGGNNAGHTLVVGGETLVVHLIPSGILHPRCVCVVGNGVVVDPEVLLGEMAQLRERGIEIEPGRLLVSAHAHAILPWHRALDRARERSLGEARIGTTGRGIGPCYEDKAARRGITMATLLDEAALRAQIARVLPEKNRMLVEWYGEPPLDADAIAAQALESGRRLGPYVGDAVSLLHRIQRRGANLLFEGAQGTFLDVDHGTYPYVTSSNTVAGAACAGAGVGPTAIDEVVGIAKAYTTRVGEGPFPTEVGGEMGERLRAVGREYGATTGRPRRCGWLDTVQLRHAVAVNGVTRLAITKLDVLSGIDPIPVCTAYESHTEFPGSLDTARPVYDELPGWTEDISACRSLGGLPANCLRYVEHLVRLVGVPVELVSVGPGRDDTILDGDLFRR